MARCRPGAPDYPLALKPVFLIKSVIFPLIWAALAGAELIQPACIIKSLTVFIGNRSGLTDLVEGAGEGSVAKAFKAMAFAGPPVVLNRNSCHSRKSTAEALTPVADWIKQAGTALPVVSQG